MYKPELGEDRSKNVPSGHDRTLALMNAQQLWLPTQDPHKIKPVNKQAGRGNDPPDWGDMNTLWPPGEESYVVFKGMAPGSWTVL